MAHSICSDFPSFIHTARMTCTLFLLMSAPSLPGLPGGFATAFAMDTPSEFSSEPSEEEEEDDDEEIKRDDQNRLIPPLNAEKKQKISEEQILLPPSYGKLFALPTSLWTSVIFPYLEFRNLKRLENISTRIQSLIQATYPRTEDLELSPNNQLILREAVRGKTGKFFTDEVYLKEELELCTNNKGIKHLKRLRLVSFYNHHNGDTGYNEPTSPQPQDIETVNQLFPELKELWLLGRSTYPAESFRLRTSDCQALALFAHLRKIVRHINPTDAYFNEVRLFLRELKNIQNLEVLILNGDTILGNNHLKNLKDCKKLDSVHFEWTGGLGGMHSIPIRDTSFYFQTSLENLKRCNIANTITAGVNRYPDSFLRTVAKHATQLQTLLISLDTLDPQLFQETKEAPQFTALKHLAVTGLPYSPLKEHLSSLIRRTPQLETLVLTATVPPLPQDNLFLSLDKAKTCWSNQEKTLLPYFLTGINALENSHVTLHTLALLIKDRPENSFFRWFSTFGHFENGDFILDIEFLIFSYSLTSFTSLETLILEIDLDSISTFFTAAFTELIKKHPSLKTLEIVSPIPLSPNDRKKLTEIRPGLQIISAPIRYTRLPTDLETW